MARRAGSEAALTVHLFLRCRKPQSGAGAEWRTGRETDLSAEPARAQAAPRLPQADVNTGRCAGDRPPPGQGPQASFRLISDRPAARPRARSNRDARSTSPRAPNGRDERYAPSYTENLCRVQAGAGRGTVGHGRLPAGGQAPTERSRSGRGSIQVSSRETSRRSSSGRSALRVHGDEETRRCSDTQSHASPAQRGHSRASAWSGPG
jgi:hypothetical protein